jgi:hypothetical protein
MCNDSSNGVGMALVHFQRTLRSHASMIVSRRDLDGNRLRGTLPASIGDLPHLTLLYENRTKHTHTHARVVVVVVVVVVADIRRCILCIY